MHRHRLMLALAVASATATVPQYILAQRPDPTSLVQRSLTAMGGEAVSAARAVRILNQ